MLQESKCTRWWKTTDRMGKKEKRIISLVSGVLLIILYITIFLFSEQDGETSGTVSFSLTKYGTGLWNKLTGGHLTQAMLEEMAVYFEHPLRKAAHFMEYAVMGILVYNVLYCRAAVRRKYLSAVLWVLLSAAADEWHQYFIPGRWASAADVMLDTAGGMTGAFLAAWGLRHAVKVRNRKEKNINKDA